MHVVECRSEISNHMVLPNSPEQVHDGLHVEISLRMFGTTLPVLVVLVYMCGEVVICIIPYSAGIIMEC